MTGKLGTPLFRRIVSSLVRERARFLKFCAVGTSGIFVNLLFVWAGNVLLFAPLPDFYKTPLSYALGIVVSIFTNFLLNYLWTWSDAERGGAARFFSRMVKFYLVSALAASVQFAVSNGLALLTRLYFLTGLEELPVEWKLLFALAGIAVGMLINFFMNLYWTFGK